MITHKLYCYRKNKGLARLFGSALLCVICGNMTSQSIHGKVRGKYDSQISRPTHTGSIGNLDGNAMKLVRAHREGSGASQHPWRTLQAAGQITYAASTAKPLPVQLTLLGDDSFRLDITTQSGINGLRIHGEYGGFVDPSGKVHPIPSETAANGLFQFHRLALSEMNDGKHAVSDLGEVQIESTSLHRIALETSLKHTYHIGNSSATAITDFYLDPKTNLVSKTATDMALNGLGTQSLLTVISYSDYRTIQGNLIPFRFQETADGQLQWTIQLNSVNLNTKIDPNAFAF